MVIVKNVGRQTGMHEQNSVEFMGILVDRQYTTGQKYAQLVFETAEGIRLSLSRNINMVRSLRLGLTYKVKGSEHTVGQKRYIHEPTATLVSSSKLSLISKHYKILIPVVVGLIVVLGGVGTLTYAAHSTNTNSSPAMQKEKPTSKLAPVAVINTPASSQPASNTAQSAPTQQQVKTAPVKSVAKGIPTPPVTAAANPVIDNAVANPVMDDTSSSLQNIQDNNNVAPDQSVAETPPVVTPPVEHTDPNPIDTP